MLLYFHHSSLLPGLISICRFPAYISTDQYPAKSFDNPTHSPQLSQCLSYLQTDKAAHLHVHQDNFCISPTGGRSIDPCGRSPIGISPSHGPGNFYPLYQETVDPPCLNHLEINLPRGILSNVLYSIPSTKILC